MNPDQHIWRVWLQKLEQVGARDATAVFLDAVGPLAVLGAQLLYLGGPLLAGAAPQDHLAALSRVLEDSTQTQAFIAFLREEPLGESL